VSLDPGGITLNYLELLTTTTESFKWTTAAAEDIYIHIYIHIDFRIIVSTQPTVNLNLNLNLNAIAQTQMAASLTRKVYYYREY
jgi:hypothetical protein